MRGHLEGTKLLAATAVLVLVAPGVGADPGPGFFATSLPAQQQAEATFVATPTPERARAWLAYLTEEPHVAGTEQQRLIAEYLREQLESFGLETEMVRYDVFLNYPRSVSLRLIEPEEIPLALIEDFYAEDKDSAKSNVLPAFHGYGAAGTATGQVVYANYGTRADFERLEKMGVSVAGRIVLARYGSVFRGLKVKEAEQRGAAGVVIYSDPADDGYMKGDVYPQGPMRPPSAIQRGSVQYLSLQPGDPSTPGTHRLHARSASLAIACRPYPEFPRFRSAIARQRKCFASSAERASPTSGRVACPLRTTWGPVEQRSRCRSSWMRGSARSSTSSVGFVAAKSPNARSSSATTRMPGLTGPSIRTPEPPPGSKPRAASPKP